jgi:hypothetical protein
VVKLRKQSGRNAGSEKTHGSIAENVEKAIPRQIYPRLQVIVAMFVEAKLLPDGQELDVHRTVLKPGNQLLTRFAGRPGRLFELQRFPCQSSVW